MNKQAGLLIATLLAVPVLAQASCESVKADISQKIIHNGVAESDFTLEIMPEGQANQADGMVVGHCENDSQKIVYKRTGRNDAASADSSGTTVQ